MHVPRGLDTPGKRLKWWRETHTDYETPTAAARMINARYPSIAISTYLGHENESQGRGIGKESLRIYAQFYGISLNWLIEGKGMPKSSAAYQAEVDLLPPEGQREAWANLAYLKEKYLGRSDA